MARIEPVDHGAAEGKAKALLDGVEKSMGGVPNLLATMARGPAALESFLALSKALSGSTIPPGVREQIALTVAGANACAYCAAAHTALGTGAGVDADELDRALRAESIDPKVQAALGFAREVVSKRGWVDDDALAAVREAGYTDGEALEIVATVVLNLLTNYVNHVAGTEIDFDRVELPEAAAV